MAIPSAHISVDLDILPSCQDSTSDLGNVHTRFRKLFSCPTTSSYSKEAWATFGCVGYTGTEAERPSSHAQEEQFVYTGRTERSEESLGGNFHGLLESLPLPSNVLHTGFGSQSPCADL